MFYCKDYREDIVDGAVRKMLQGVLLIEVFRIKMECPLNEMYPEKQLCFPWRLLSVKNL